MSTTEDDFSRIISPKYFIILSEKVFERIEIINRLHSRDCGLRWNREVSETKALSYN
jgi:hypothetical protein